MIYLPFTTFGDFIMSTIHIYERTLSSVLDALIINAKKYEDGLITLGELGILMSHGSLNLVDVQKDGVTVECRIYDTNEANIKAKYCYSNGEVEMSFRNYTPTVSEL